MTQRFKVTFLLTATSFLSAASTFAQNSTQNQTTSPNLYSNSASQVIGPTILPEAAGSVNGGNPFQGLGRPDDTGPMRTTPLQQYTPGNNADGLYSTGSSFPSTQSVEQPGFGGQAGFSSNNTSNNPGTINPALNQSSIPALNQAPGETNPGPNAALLQNLNPLPQPNNNGETRSERGELQSQKIRADKSENESSEDSTAVDKLLSRSHKNHGAKYGSERNRESSQLATALKEMNSGEYKKSLETLDGILKTEPKNAQVYYVKAVTNVMMRDFIHARQNYEMTLRCTTDDELVAKAKAGLRKLGR